MEVNNEIQKDDGDTCPVCFEEISSDKWLIDEKTPFKKSV